MTKSCVYTCANHSPTGRQFVSGVGTIVVAAAIAVKCDGDPRDEGVPDGHQFNRIPTAVTTNVTSVRSVAVL